MRQIVPKYNNREGQPCLPQHQYSLRVLHARGAAVIHGQGVLLGQTRKIGYVGIAVREPVTAHEDHTIFSVSVSRKRSMIRAKARLTAEPSKEHCALREGMRLLRKPRRLFRFGSGTKILSAIHLQICGFFDGDGRCGGVCVSQCFALSAIHRSVARSCHSSQGEVVQR